MAKNSLRAFLAAAYKDDDSLVSTMTAALDSYADQEIDLARLASTFAAAASSRGETVSQVISQVESAPAFIPAVPENWETTKADILKISERIKPGVIERE